MFTTSLVFNILPLAYCAYIFGLLLIFIVVCAKRMRKNCVHLQSIMHQALIQIICLTSFEQVNRNIYTSRSSYDNVADLSGNTTKRETKKTKIPSENYWNSDGTSSHPRPTKYKKKEKIYVGIYKFRTFLKSSHSFFSLSFH